MIAMYAWIAPCQIRKKTSGWSILTLPSTDSSKHGLLGFAATLAGIPNVAGKQRHPNMRPTKMMVNIKRELQWG